MGKLLIKKEFEGQTIQFARRRGIITLNDRTTQAELKLLFELQHPAIYIEAKKEEAKK